MNQTSTPSIDLLISELLSGALLFARKSAADRLGTLPESTPLIVSALIAAQESDDHSEVRQAAEQALRAPAHSWVREHQRDQVVALVAVQKGKQFHTAVQTKSKPTRRQRILGFLAFVIYMAALLSVSFYLQQRGWDDASLWIAVVGWSIGMSIAVMNLIQRSGYKGISTVVRVFAIGVLLFAILWFYPRKEISDGVQLLLMLVVVVVESWDAYRLG